MSRELRIYKSIAKLAKKAGIKIKKVKASVIDDVSGEFGNAGLAIQVGGSFVLIDIDSKYRTGVTGVFVMPRNKEVMKIVEMAFFGGSC